MRPGALPQGEAAESREGKTIGPHQRVMPTIQKPGPRQRHEKGWSEREQDAREHIEDGQEVVPTLAALEDALLGAGFSGVDYAVLADARSLAPIDTLTGAPARLLVAARIGGTRLIDNMAVD